jgi:hypothetical protein
MHILKVAVVRAVPVAYADVESLSVQQPPKPTVASPPSASPSKKRKSEIPEVLPKKKKGNTL